MQTQQQKKYTPTEYLNLETNSQQRHEYINGEIIPMTGGTPNHNQIALNFSAALNFSLKRKPYRVFVADQRLWIQKKRIYTYPDVMVNPGNLELQQGRKDTITNPLIIVEVLSNSTRNYDKDKKFAAYRTIPIFQEYLLIDQYTIQVEQYYKTSQKQWIFSEYNELEETISLNSIDFQITLADIYDKVEFETTENSDN
ncbi:MAG: Uma2 family endonuclease [Okeania sp. SIO2F4]|uniref:Uma2 family endonuclease n=1 Tax=Okeania sp. SIO2F4 TaxID=2607790 RepID=UPI00142C4244|nr:Uma2 family endonuclease [Okeania sp. SIO2F4]NES05179.1 Uma2 family endonuclease [Okeania sp. SIO2F4]